MGDVADVLGLEKTNAVDSKAMDPHVVAMTAMSKRGGTRKGKGKKSQPKPPGMSREVMCVCCVCERERGRDQSVLVSYLDVNQSRSISVGGVCLLLVLGVVLVVPL